MTLDPSFYTRYDSYRDFSFEELIPYEEALNALMRAPILDENKCLRWIADFQPCAKWEFRSDPKYAHWLMFHHGIKTCCLVPMEWTSPDTCTAVLGNTLDRWGCDWPLHEGYKHVFLIRGAVKEFAEKFGLDGLDWESLQPVPVEPATAQADMTTKERNTWATLVKVLCLEAKISLDKPYKAAGIIKNMAAQHRVDGWPAKDDTIASKLRAAKEAE